MVGDRKSGSRIPLAFRVTVDYWGERGECQGVTGTEMRRRGNITGRCPEYPHVTAARPCWMGNGGIPGSSRGGDATIPAILLQPDLGPGELFPLV